MILEEIITHKRQEVAAREADVPLEEMARCAAATPPARKLALDDRVALIAEVKRRSPSAGDLSAAMDPATRARAYQDGGAAAISVLTDAHYFHGSFADLDAVRAAVQLPVLCKDFIVTPYQMYEARCHGADLVLLIVAALEDRTLMELHDLAEKLGMTALVEVHDQHELARAIALGARLIGINNRDLRDFSVDLVTTEYLMPLVPDDIPVVSESGIVTREDVDRAAAAGARLVLVGETLMRASDPAATIRGLLA